MQNWTIRARIVAAFSLIIVVLVVLSVVTYGRLRGIRTEAALMQDDVLPGVLLSGEIRTSSKDLLPAVLTRATASDAQARARAAATIERVIADLERAETQYERTVTTDDDRRLTAAVRATQAQFVAAYRTAARDDVLTPTEADLQLRPPLVQLAAQTDSLVAINRMDGEHSVATIVGLVDSSITALLVAIAVAALVALACAWLLVRLLREGLSRLLSAAEVMSAGDFRERIPIVRRDELGMLSEGINVMADALTGLIGQVQRSGIQVNSSATEIAATSKQQQATATEIAATTSEVGATASRISATSKELVRTMDEVVRTADQTAALAEEGQGGLRQMGTSMRQISEASGLINSRLALLSEKAANIGLVVTTINKVADQTNLLSLNAAIEAEKAGEHGRGFTVVAREIRRLADQTAGATLDIEQLVKEMQSAVSAGVMGMDKFSDEVRRGGEVIGQVTVQLTGVIEQVQAMTPSFDAVNEGMKSQSISAGQISDALAQLSVAAQQTAESLRQSNMAIEQLNDAARGLQSGVSRFTLAS